jgi:hypothetical protein
LRFSPKLPGSHINEVEKYIDKVAWSAKTKPGSRVRYWNEAVDRCGVYTWQEVNNSFKSYGQVGYGTLDMIYQCSLTKLHEPDELDIPTSVAQFVLGADPTGELGLQLFSIRSVLVKGKVLWLASMSPKVNAYSVGSPFHHPKYVAN